MSAIERQVRLAQHRLWLNRWLTQWGWSLLIAMSLWLMGWIVNRLFGLYPFPALWTLAGAAGASLIAATVWLVLTRDPQLAAATALDQAAGLRERVSTGLMLKSASDDPFEAAVIQDATARVTGLAPRKFLPIRWPGSLSWSSVVLLVALLSLLLPEFDLLNHKEQSGVNAAQAGMKSRTQAVLAKTNQTIDKIAEQNQIDLEGAQKKAPKMQMPDKADPDFKRRETLKKLDRLQDALKNKIGAEKFQALKEAKKRMKQAGEQVDSKSELTELLSAMASNDFDQAEKAVKKLQEKLARRAAEGGPNSEDVKKMQEQLKDMAKKLQEANKSANEQQKQQQSRQLQNAGMSREEAERTLEELSKKDPEQLKKMAKELAERLKEKGVTQEQMQKMLEKMQEQMKACEKAGQQCEKMGQKMDQAGKQMEKGNMQQAQQELQEAGEQLSEMEQMEQALNDLESQLSELEQSQQQMENDANDGEQEDDLACKDCDGTGFRQDGSPCPKCNGSGQCPGSGNRGRGAGNRERDDNVETATENKKAKTRFGRGGGIVGQSFVKDKQLKGESTATMGDANSAGEIDDTDAVERERIPRQYRKAVKRYFDRSDGRSGQDDSKPKDEPESEDGGKKEAESDKPKS